MVLEFPERSNPLHEQALHAPQPASTVSFVILVGIVHFTTPFFTSLAFDDCWKIFDIVDKFY